MLSYYFNPQSSCIKVETVGPSVTSIYLFTICMVFAPNTATLNVITCFSVSVLLRNKILQYTQFLFYNNSEGISYKVHYNSKYNLAQAQH